MNTLKRNVTFIPGYLACWILYLWFSPIVRPPACYIADASLVIAGVGGLVWANHGGFRRIRWRWLRATARLTVGMILFLVLAMTVVLYGWRIQPRIDSLLTPSSPEATQEQGSFSPYAFGSNTELSAFEVGWYTNQLTALGEGSFYSLASDTNARAFRFTCLRSFHNPFSVIMTFDGNGRALVTGKMASGAGGYAPGALCRLRRTTIQSREAQKFLDLVAAESFWTLPSKIETLGCDGSQWIIEGVDHGTYHLVDRWTPEESSPVGRLGREMLYLSKMRIWFLY